MHLSGVIVGAGSLSGRNRDPLPNLKTIDDNSKSQKGLHAVNNIDQTGPTVQARLWHNRARQPKVPGNRCQAFMAIASIRICPHAVPCKRRNLACRNKFPDTLFTPIQEMS